MSQSYAYIHRPIDEENTSTPFRQMVHANARGAELPNLSRQEERELISLAKSEEDGADAAIEKLVDHHRGFILGMVQNIATYNQVEPMIDDLMSEGVAALIKAIGKYKLPKHHVRLNSFARYHIAGDVMTYALRNRHAFPIGTSSGERIFVLNYQKHMLRFEKIYGHEFQSTNPADVALMAELTTASGASIRRVCAIKQSGPTLSTEQIHIIENSDDACGEGSLLQRERAKIICEILLDVFSSLKPRNLDIVKTLLGDAENASAQRAPLAKRHGITAERVGQIHREALALIRSRLEARGIKSAQG